MEDEKWLEKIKDRLSNHLEPVPCDGWKRLEKALGVESVRRRGRVVMPLRRRLLAMAAAFLAVTGIGSLVLLYAPGWIGTDVSSFRLAENACLYDIPDSRVMAASGRIEKDLLYWVLPLASVKEDRFGSEYAPSLLSYGTGKSHVTDIPLVVRSGSEKSAMTEDSLSVDRKQAITENIRLEDEADFTLYKNTIPANETVKKGKGWSWSMSGNIAGAGSENLSPSLREGIAGVSTTYLSGQVLTRAVPEGQEIELRQEMPYLLGQNTRIASINHKQPISVGVTLRKRLPKGFSVETGLIYTYLASDVTFVGSSDLFEQKLHYIGVPLRASWAFFQRGPFSLYMSAGGMVEKCVHSDLFEAGNDVEPLQWSVAGAMGAQFDISRHVGIYAEPGVAYYFDDGSSVQTIRKENPCSFTMQAGFRFSY